MNKSFTPTPQRPQTSFNRPKGSGRLVWGFTLIETITIGAVLVILISIAIPAIYGLDRSSSLENGLSEVIGDLRLARARALGSEGDSPWGVYFNQTASPHQYILFQGADYASREPLLDETHTLPKTIEFSALNLEGAGVEVVFQKVTGQTAQFGEVTLDFKEEPSDPKVIYIADSGNVAVSASSVSDDDRIKDSRHTHFTYTRFIDTATESIILTFSGGVVIENILIDSNMAGGQIFWEGEIDVDGEIQKIKIHTHSINQGGNTTEFCVHRDLRYNTKPLGIDIDGDADYPDPIAYTLLEFLADNSTVKGSSLDVSDPIWQ